MFRFCENHAHPSWLWRIFSCYALKSHLRLSPPPAMLELDHFDLALLDVLQRFGRATHQQLGEQVPLSPSQIGRRLQRLEAIGVIEGYRVMLRPEKLGLGVTAFTSLKLKHHGD